MRRYLPIIISILVMFMAGYIVISKKNSIDKTHIKSIYNIGTFKKQHSCIKLPNFLKRLKIPQPMIIDLSQKRYKGIALYFGKNFRNVMHPKQWEQYGYFSTYSLDSLGNIYLVPMPFISIYPTTFNLQKNIYKIDSNTGKLSIFMHFDDIVPSATNPYGFTSIVYDCDDNTLWCSAIDESDYQHQKGVIYHIDIKTKRVLQHIDDIDVLSLAIVKSSKGKYLLAGMARDNSLYAYAIKDKKAQKAKKLLELPSSQEHIRKIKVEAKNRLDIQAIPFSYTLITQTAQKDRVHYSITWIEKINKWRINR